MTNRHARRKAAATAAPEAPAADPVATLALTQSECAGLIQIIDVFVKTTGLNGATPGLALVAKIDAAAKAAFTPQEG